jgi:hypothetical protein
MNNKVIKYILLLALAIIAAIVIFEFVSNNPDKRPSNPFEFNVDNYKAVDEALISHKETRQIVLKEGNPRAIAFSQGKIYLLVDDYLQVILPGGIEVFKRKLSEKPNCITVNRDGYIIIGFENRLRSYDPDGIEMHLSEIASDKSNFTALAVSDDLIYVADAGAKQIRVYDKNLQQKHVFNGESGVSDVHGFILPSAHFDLAVNSDNELWAVNPGLHAIQNYSETGRLRGFWSKSSFENDGFSGCCNPYYIAFLSDGSFVTSEKGLIRIKIHKESGELSSVVAAPEKFSDGTKAPALAVDESDNIIALDFDRKMIRFFEPK